MGAMIRVAAVALLAWAGFTCAAAAYEPDDPFHNRYLFLLGKIVLAARDGDVALRQTAERELDEDLKHCGQSHRDALAKRIKAIVSEPRYKRTLAAHALLLLATLDFATGHPDRAKEPWTQLLNSAIGDGDVKYTSQVLLEYLQENRQYSVSSQMVQVSGVRAVFDFFGHDVASKFVDFGGVIEKISYLEGLVVSDIGRSKVANLYLLSGQRQAAKDIALNISDNEYGVHLKLLFLDGSQRSGICEVVRSNMRCDGGECLSENSHLSYWNWNLLVCGFFSDARVYFDVLKYSYASSPCGLSVARVPATLGNAVLATANLATAARLQGEHDEADRLLDDAVADARRIGYITRYDGYLVVNDMIDSGINIYMDRLFGISAEMNVVKGVLEQIRGRSEAARTAWQAALEGGLTPVWQWRVEGWSKALPR